MLPDDYSNPQGGNAHPEEALAAFALNALDDAEFQDVLNHVVQCPHCQEVVLGFQDTAARLTGAAPESPMPSGMKARVLAAATGRGDIEPPNLPPADPRWSMRRLRRWLAPTAVGVLGLLLAVSLGVITLQQREINDLSAAMQTERQLIANIAEAQFSQESARALQTGVAPITLDSGTLERSAIPAGAGAEIAIAARVERSIQAEMGQVDAAVVESSTASKPDDMIVANAEKVDQMKQDMAEVVEATVLSAQPETEKVPMSSPMGTEPEAKGVLMVEPNGRRGVLMVSGMPADSYQIWLVRSGHQVLVDRVVVNDNNGAGVKQLELDESIFQFQQVALMPDERHGPTNPTGEQFLSALIIPAPPNPPR